MMAIVCARVRLSLCVCVCLYRDKYEYTDEIPEAMPAYLHLICSFSSYANDIAVAIREVFKHKVKGPEGLQREICEILCIVQRAYP